MLTPKFLEVEKLLTSAKCPEDYFGAPGDSVSLTEYLRKKARRFKDATSKSALGELDSNGKDRLGRLKRIFPLMYKWAIEKMAADTYGDMKTYRTKIVWMVKEYEGKRRFCLQGLEGFDISTEWIDALFFEGHDRRDSVTTRTKEKETSGYVHYYGTHGAREAFYLDSEDQPYLGAEYYEVGDSVEIETASYGNVDEYAGFLIRGWVELPQEVRRATSNRLKKKDWNDAEMIQILRDANVPLTFFITDED